MRVLGFLLRELFGRNFNLKRKITMTREEKLIKSKLGLLELAEYLKNVS